MKEAYDKMKKLSITIEEFWSNINDFTHLQASGVNEYFETKFRSSTIFPIYKLDSNKCYISFLTYWVKKHGSKVAIKLTARNLLGEKKGELWLPITNYKVHNLDVNEFDYFSNAKDGFCGSIEVEVFSPNAPLYTFPAISLFYENDLSTSVVHSCMRTYNSDEKNLDYAIDFPQTGFDAVLGSNKRNYICFYGGNKSKYTLNISIEINSKDFTFSIVTKNYRYGQQHLIFIEDLFQFHDNDKIGKVSINHNLDVFPRFYVGIINRNAVPTLTHTFFDTSEKHIFEKNINHLTLRAKNKNAKKYYDSAFFIPLFKFNNFNTIIRTYGQNLDFSGDIILNVFTSDGGLVQNRLLSHKEVLNWNTNYSYDLSKECKLLGLDPEVNYNIFIGFDGLKLSFPKRFKLGLNVSKVNTDLGTNICFAPLVQVEGTLDKPFTRRWFPIGGNSNIIGTIHLTDFEKSPEKKFIKTTVEFINIYGEVLTRELNLLCNSSVVFDSIKDDELFSFLKDEIGWCYVTAHTYNIDAYYFAEKHNQIGGDHAF